MDIKIYFSSDSDLSEYEAISKGYRHEIFVKINQSLIALKRAGGIRND